MNIEEAVIGWILEFSPDALAQALGAGCRAEWFGDEKCRALWSIIEEAAPKYPSVSAVVLANEIAAKGMTERITLVDLSRILAAAVPTSMSFRDALRWLAADYARKVRSGLWMEGSEAAKKADSEHEEATSDRIAETFADMLPPETLQQAASELAGELGRGEPADYGIPTGLVDIDRGMGSLQPGELIVVAARPGCGKSSILRQIACRTAIDGRKVAVVSTEMGAKEIVRAAARQLSGVAWRRGESLPAAERAEYLEALRRISVLSTLRLTEDRRLSTMLAKWRALMGEEFPPQLFVVDYLQQLDSDMRKGETLAAAVGRISSALKGFAKDNRVVVLAAAQLNRESAKDSDPQLHHLRDSGAIEQDADRVLMMRLDESQPAEMRRCTVDVFQRKNRNGPVGQCRLTFDRWTTRFANYAAT
jgi:replicative DNA helicase